MNTENNFPLLFTKRLELIQITEENAQDLFELFSDRQVTKFYDVVPFTSVTEASDLIEKFQKRYEEKTGIRWGIRLKGTTEIIGTVGFNNYARLHRANIGYDLKHQYWNKGISTEVTNEVVKYGFKVLEVNRIEAEVMQGNFSSGRVLEKCGFRKEGVLRQWKFWNDRYYDIVMYSILRSDVNL